MAVTEIPLLERGAELDEIESAVRQAARDHGSVLVIEGEAGIGKTRLLRAGQELALSEGMTTLTARGSQLERGFAFGVARQLFQSPLASLPEDQRRQALSGAAALAASLLAPTEDDAKPTAGPDVFSMLHGLHWLCANLALTQPLMLAVDDVQWSDENSLRFLAYLTGRVEELPVLVVATLRTGEPDSPEELLRELRLQPASRSLRPGSLSLDATVSMVRGAVSPEAEPGFCAACHESTAGNPLLLSELVRALEVEEIAPVADCATRVLEIGARGVPERLLARIAQLSPAALAVARAVATLEPHATLRRAAVLASLDAEEAAGAAHALVEAGVLVDDEWLSFVHPLLRSAVEGAMTTPQRSQLAARAAEVHWEDDSPSEIVASHLLKAEGEPPDWALEALAAAADDALARGAPQETVTYLRRAVALAPAADTPRLRTRLGSALLRATDAEGVEILLAERTANPDAIRRAQMAHELAVPLMIRQRPEEAIGILEESIGQLGPEERELSLTLHADLIQTVLNSGGGERLRAEVERLRSFAPELAGTTLGERLALQAVALPSALGLDNAPAALRVALRALGTEESIRKLASVGFPLSIACVAAAMSGGPEAAMKVWAVVVEEMRKRGSSFGIAQALGTRAMVRLSRGELAEADADLPQLRQLAGLPLIGAATHGVGARIKRERGQADLALRAMAEAGFAGELPQNQFALMLRIERGLTRLDQGQAEAALLDLEAAATAYGVVGTFGADLLPARLHVGLAIQATGNSQEAIAEARRTEAWARETQNPRFIGDALRARGLIDPEAGIDALREGVELLASTQFKLDLARAQVDLGAALRRAQERKASRDPLREGMELAHRCGATALVDRARTELEATGAKPRSIIVSGVESLTPSERRVAQLAAEGMTNREIAQTLYVTAKTVETHLRHCYQKLEISGRGELSGALQTEHERPG